MGEKTTRLDKISYEIEKIRYFGCRWPGGSNYVDHDYRGRGGDCISNVIKYICMVWEYRTMTTLLITSMAITTGAVVGVLLYGWSDVVRSLMLIAGGMWISVTLTVLEPEQDE